MLAFSTTFNGAKNLDVLNVLIGATVDAKGPRLGLDIFKIIQTMSFTVDWLDLIVSSLYIY